MDGEVVLYAIIRKDGSVDSIQLVHSVDPHLDANAMEALAQWKFRPAEKHGEPVDLEAVVYIPFRVAAADFVAPESCLSIQEVSSRSLKFHKDQNRHEMPAPQK